MGKKTSPRFYVNAVSRWKKEIAATNRPIAIFSPYITEPTIKTVISHPSKSFEVFTVFAAENFASGGSSIKALRWLVEHGVAAFHLPNLHAKLVLPGNGTASVGSQNLTGRGTRSLEGSIITNDARVVRSVTSQSKEWRRMASRITIDMIAEIETALDDARKLYRSFHEMTNDIDKQVFQAEIMRQQQKRREEIAISLEQYRRDRLAVLKRTLDVGIASSSRKVWLEKLEANDRHALCRSHKEHNLTEWLVNEQRVLLPSMYRYLCVDTDSGRLAWIRLAMSRAAYFDMSRDAFYFAAGAFRLSASFHANWRIGELWLGVVRDYNLTIEVRPSSAWYAPPVTLRVYFSIESMDLLGVEPLPADPEKRAAIVPLYKWVTEDFDGFRVAILPHMLDRYRSSLRGPDARTFLPGDHYRYGLAVHEFGPKHVLSVRAI